MTYSITTQTDETKYIVEIRFSAADIETLHISAGFETREAAHAYGTAFIAGK